MEAKKKLYAFLDGVAYPLGRGYHVRLGIKWQFVDSNEYPNTWQLIRKCRVNTYRYPFVQFPKDKYDLFLVSEKAGSLNHIKEIIGDVEIKISRR